MYWLTNIVKLFHTTYISVDLAHIVIFYAKVGKGGIFFYTQQSRMPTPKLILMTQSAQRFQKENKCVNYVVR